MSRRSLAMACAMGMATLSAALSPRLAAGQAEPRVALITDVHVTGYDGGRQRVVVQAARAYAGTRRFGFFHTALLPTLELEDVAVEWLREDGARERLQLEAAVIDWTSKTVLTAAGKALVSPHRQLGQPD